MSSPVLDFVGNPIHAGNTIVYPVRQGSSLWMRRMVVTQVRANALTGYSPDGRTVHVKNIGNVSVVVPPASGKSQS